MHGGRHGLIGVHLAVGETLQRGEREFQVHVRHQLAGGLARLRVAKLLVALFFNAVQLFELIRVTVPVQA